MPHNSIVIRVVCHPKTALNFLNSWNAYAGDCLFIKSIPKNKVENFFRSPNNERNQIRFQIRGYYERIIRKSGPNWPIYCEPIKLIPVWFYAGPSERRLTEAAFVTNNKSENRERDSFANLRLLIANKRSLPDWIYQKCWSWAQSWLGRAPKAFESTLADLNCSLVFF